MVLEILFIIVTAAFALYGGYKLITEYAGRKRAKGAPPTEEIRAELRQQWLELAPGEKEIPGVEWEGEIYYETPK